MPSDHAWRYFCTDCCVSVLACICAPLACFWCISDTLFALKKVKQRSSTSSNWGAHQPLILCSHQSPAPCLLATANIQCVPALCIMMLLLLLLGCLLSTDINSQHILCPHLSCVCCSEIVTTIPTVCRPDSLVPTPMAWIATCMEHSRPI